MAVLLSVVACTGLSAQSLDRAVLGAAGGETQEGKIQLQWTLGETAIQTHHMDEGLLTEGFHQPELRVESPEQQALPESFRPEQASPGLELTAFPNPTPDQLQVKLFSTQDGEGQLELRTATGQCLWAEPIRLRTGHQQLPMANYAAGTYYLCLRGATGRLLQTLKVTKM
jgi:hypothetical protein